MSLPCRFLVDGSWIWKKNSSRSRYEIWSGSKTISTASAWSPWLRYVAFGVSPPEYPTRVEITPGRRRSSCCAPQKHPPARIAVSVVAICNLLHGDGCGRRVILTPQRAGAQPTSGRGRQNRSGAGAHHEGGGQRDGGRLPPLDQLDQQAHHLAGDPHQRLAHGGERRVEVRCEPGVVEASDGDVLRDPSAGLAERLQRPRSHQVGAHEHRVEVGSALEEHAHRHRAPFARVVTVGHERLVVERAELVAVALEPEPAAGGVQGSGDRRDPGAADVEQVPRHPPPAPEVVGGDVAEPALEAERDA